MIIASNVGLIRVWLVTPEAIEAAPEKTEYQILQNSLDLPLPFTGKKTVITRVTENDSILITCGWEPVVKGVTDYYPAPSNACVFDGGVNICFTIKEDIDPCLGITDENIIKSVVKRKLVDSVSDYIAATPAKAKP